MVPDYIEAHPLTIHALKVTRLSFDDLLKVKVHPYSSEFPETWPMVSPVGLLEQTADVLMAARSFALLVWFFSDEADADEYAQHKSQVNHVLLSDEYALIANSYKEARSRGGNKTAKTTKQATTANIEKALKRWEKLGDNAVPEHKRSLIIANEMKITPATVRRYLKK